MANTTKTGRISKNFNTAGTFNMAKIKRDFAAKAAKSACRSMEYMATPSAVFRVAIGSSVNLDAIGSRCTHRSLKPELQLIVAGLFARLWLLNVARRYQHEHCTPTPRAAQVAALSCFALLNYLLTAKK